MRSLAVRLVWCPPQPIFDRRLGGDTGCDDATAGQNHFGTRQNVEVFRSSVQAEVWLVGAQLASERGVSPTGCNLA